MSEPPVAVKLAFLDALRDAGIGKSEFGRRIGKDEKEARCLLDPTHPTKLSTLTEALASFSSSALKPQPDLGGNNRAMSRPRAMKNPAHPGELIRDNMTSWVCPLPRRPKVLAS